MSTDDMSTDDTRPVPSPEQPHDTAAHDTAIHDTAIHDTAVHDTAVHDTAAHDTDPPSGGRHPLSIGYLVAGLVFLGIAASWALRASGVVDTGDSRWLFPLTLVVVGSIGLVASVASSRRR